MRTKYIDLIDQTFDFPQDEFNLQDDRLIFHGIDLMRLIEQYGTPLKFNYLPQISFNIQRAKGWFREAEVTIIIRIVQKVLTLLSYWMRYCKTMCILKLHLPLISISYVIYTTMES